MMEKRTFAKIFTGDITSGSQQVSLSGITIPQIQRDYAQGRDMEDVKKIRTRFLLNIKKAVTDGGVPLTLDFIYGDIDANGVLLPLDGQQRLTTLFLLHWYAAQKDGVSDAEQAFLSRFTYKTRPSASAFCEKLVRFRPTFSSVLSAEIFDQAWFPSGWRADPTIDSMLVMLDAIDEHFKDVSGLWKRLVQDDAISFYFLPIKNMGLTDEIYVKMNSRGKPLTTFEHVKADLEGRLEKIDAKRAEEIAHKMDVEWSNMLWDLRSSNVIDDMFLRYFRYLCDIMCYMDGSTPYGRVDRDDYSLSEEYFGDVALANGKAIGHMDFFEKCFDIWCKENKQPGGIDGFFKRCESDSKLLETATGGNYFVECLQGYSYGDKGKFTFAKRIMLYAFIHYLLNKEAISEDAFKRRIRIVRNLVDNSSNEMSDSATRVGGNRIPAILRVVDSIIEFGEVPESGTVSFNAYQLEEEARKIKWLAENPSHSSSLFALEDHRLLYGRIGIVGLDHPERFERFAALFDRRDFDCVDCAMMAISDIMLVDGRGGSRYQGGSARAELAWKELFHRDAQSLGNIKIALGGLLQEANSQTDDALRKLAESYLIDCQSKCKFDWRYYYIMYHEFRPGKSGKYIWDENRDCNPYVFRVVQASRFDSSNSYSPYLKVAENKGFGSVRTSIHNGDNLQLNDGRRVFVNNEAFVIKDGDAESVVDEWRIDQDEGLDAVDRIQLLLGKINK